MPPKPNSEGITRTPSGRNKKKAEATQNTLGGTPTAVRPNQQEITTTPMTSFHLVVCGAISPEKDGFIFADFMAFCKFLIDKNVGGTYLSCFPLDKHFGELSKRNPPITDIKFGISGPGGSPLLTYSRWQYTNRELWWEDIRKDQIKSRVMNWIAETAQRAVPGDMVNIILEGHGGGLGQLRLGDQHLGAYEFKTAIGAFVPGVQVNAISGACHSGMFLDCIQASNQTDRYIATACGSKELAYGNPRSPSNRSRGSRYEQAWIQSFAKLSIFGESQQTDDNTATSVREHEEYIRNNILRIFPPTADPARETCQTPQFYVDTAITLDMAIEDMVVRDKIDILYDPLITSRRRRIECPTQNPEFAVDMRRRLAQGRTPSQSAREQAISLLEEEAAKCDRDMGVPYDIPIFDNFPLTDNTRIAKVLAALYCRARLQSTLLDLFTVLVQRGFTRMESLRTPVALRSNSDASFTVGFLLSCFEGLNRFHLLDGDEEKQPHPLFESQSTDEAANWLATMIVRGCANIPRLFETIRISGLVGGIDDEAFRRYKLECDEKTIVCDVNDRVADCMLPNDFGFWLPHGLGDIPAAEIPIVMTDSRFHFNRIERVYKDYFGVPDGVLLTEEQQAKYFDEHLDRFTGTIGEYLQSKAAYRRASGQL